MLVSSDFNTQTDDDLPLVSIIIPVYNSALFLSECIDSVLHQNYKKLEIICIDDGSTDASWKILEYYSRKDSRISCIHQENAGQSVARNNGMQMATGDYICFLDSDDFLIPNAILQCIEAFEKYQVDIVLYNMEMFLPNGQHFKCFSGKLYTHRDPILHSATDEICVNFTNAAAGMYKRRDLIENNIIFPVGMIYEDWVFMIRLMTAKDFSVFWMDSPLYWYRRDFAASTTSNISYKCLDLFKAYWMADTQLKAAGDRSHQFFINDEKIVNEGVGFLIARLQDIGDRDIFRAYLQEYLRIISRFSTGYMYSLCSFLMPERVEIAYCMYQNMQQTDLDELIEKVQLQMKRQNLKKQIHRLKNKSKNMIMIVYRNMKRVMRYIFPAYRVSSDLREKVDFLLQQNEQLRCQIKFYEKYLPRNNRFADSAEEGLDYAPRT